MKIGVELEPPKGAYTTLSERKFAIDDEIKLYSDFVHMISITNRPVFGLSSITMAKRVQKLVGNPAKKVRINLHLTTRLSHFDTYREVLDAERIGLTDLLPILGDPRGPINNNYFDNGFDILGFVSYLKSGNTDYLTEKYQEMNSNGQRIEPLEYADFNIGSIIDLNPVNILHHDKVINIRDKQIAFARKKEKLGAEYLISQGIFDADYYFDFIDQADLKIPIYVGLIPARVKFIELFGLPIGSLQKSKLRAQFTSEEEKIEGNKITNQVYEDLKDRGCETVHVYSLGSPINFAQITNLELNLDIIEMKNKIGDISP